MNINVKKFVDEVYHNLDLGQLKEATESEKVSTYMDSVIRVMRNTIRKSNVCKFNNKIHIFNGCFYEPISFPQFQFGLEEVMKDNNVNASYWKRIVDSCASELEGKEISSASNHVICFTNGVVDLEEYDNIHVAPFSPKFHVFYQLPYEFNNEAKHRLWSRFLNQVLPDKELQYVLQEFLGVIFIDRSKSKIEKILWLLGSGSNGKSVVFETIIGVLGRENCTHIDLSDLTSGDNRDKNIARINGKLLNYCSEVSRRSIASDFANNLISGEPLPAREMYGAPFTAYNIPMMMANTNKMPKSNYQTPAYYRRIIIIPFNVTIPERMQDRNLHHKLRSEYSGILNWILAGRKRIMANNYQFTKSRLVERKIVEYKRSDDTITRFMADSGYKQTREDRADKGVSVGTLELYGEYVRWCNKRKIAYEERITTVKGFSNVLTELEYEKERSREGVKIHLYGRYHNRY